jgi:acetyltransferase-like isoleucine patch superfamily enzyme
MQATRAWNRLKMQVALELLRPRLGPLAVVSVNTKIGAGAIVDMHVSIGLDAMLKNFSALCTGARISGRCRIGEYALVGSNATLHPRTEMGGRAVVGASSLASALVEPDTTVQGVPARIIYRKSSVVRYLLRLARRPLGMVGANRRTFCANAPRDQGRV